MPSRITDENFCFYLLKIISTLIHTNFSPFSSIVTRKFLDFSAAQTCRQLVAGCPYGSFNLLLSVAVMITNVISISILLNHLCPHVPNGIHPILRIFVGCFVHHILFTVVVDIQHRQQATGNCKRCTKRTTFDMNQLVLA